MCLPQYELMAVTSSFLTDGHLEISLSHHYQKRLPPGVGLESQLLCKLRQKDHKFKAILGNLVKLCLKTKTGRLEDIDQW